MKKIWLIGGFTLIHAIISGCLFLQSFGAGMRRFDTGLPAGIGEKIIDFFTTFLLWPIFYPLVHWGPRSLVKLFSGLAGYIPIMLNSLIWGIVAYWLYMSLRRTNGRHAR